MSSIEMKNFTNMFCRLIGSLRDSEFICHEFMADAMQIKSSFHKMSILPNATDPDLLIDDDEVKNLQKENEEMKKLLADYHRGVELLMAAYRERVVDNMLQEQMETVTNVESSSAKPEFFDQKLFETIIQQSEQIYQMHNVMRCASNADVDAEILVAEQMAFLRKENEILKELYEASKKFGTAQNRLRFNELSLREIGVQTEKIVNRSVNIEPVEAPQCVEQNWKNFENWKQQRAVESSYSKFESEDEDEITVVDFQTRNKNKTQNDDKKNVSAQAYTF